MPSPRQEHPHLSTWRRRTRVGAFGDTIAGGRVEVHRAALFVVSGQPGACRPVLGGPAAAERYNLRHGGSDGLVYGQNLTRGGSRLECVPPPDTIEWHDALDAGHVLILGEVHGTQEAPAFVLSVVCEALRRHRRVGVFLEWPDSMQAALTDLAHLLAAPFFEDGRHSAAMVELATTVLAWREKGADVDLIAMDPSVGDHDVGMCARVRAWTEHHRRGVALVLVGNVHARLTTGWRDDARYRPLGSLLAAGGRSVAALDMRVDAGSTTWSCRADGCGVHDLYGTDLGASPSVYWDAQDGAFSGWFYVGRTHASAR